MIPVMQTKRGGPDVPPEERGDCMDACLASLLEVAIGDVPVPHDVDDWWETAQEAVARHAHRLVYLFEDQPVGVVARWLGDVYWIASVPSLNLGAKPDGTPVMHLIVMRGGEVAHDPSLGASYQGRLHGDTPIREGYLLLPLAPTETPKRGREGDAE